MESNTIWFVTIGVLATVIAFDLLLAILRRNKETTLLEASFWTVFYVGAAIVFGFFLPMWTSDQAQKDALKATYHSCSLQAKESDALLSCAAAGAIGCPVCL